MQFSGVKPPCLHPVRRDDRGDACFILRKVDRTKELCGISEFVKNGSPIHIPHLKDIPARDEYSASPIHTLQTGDVVLVCSDGLWKVGARVFEPALEWIAGNRERAATLQELVNKLIAEALCFGSDDNVSVALIHYGERDATDGLRKTRPY